MENKEFLFYQYLKYFYQSKRKMIRATYYKSLTNKFLDFNDPINVDSFLKRPQYEALEMYIFLKEYLHNQHLCDIFKDWYYREGGFTGRESQAVVKGLGKLYDPIDDRGYKEKYETLKKYKHSYPNYIFALTMRIGKTILMATSIFYEFLLANKFPKDKRFCHNALVFAPDKTVFQSLKEIQAFDKSKVIPPEFISWLGANLKFHYLDNNDTTLNVIDENDFNIIITNTQKIISKRRNKKQNAVQQIFLDMDLRYKAKSIDPDYNCFINEIELTKNQRFMKLTRINQLGIYVDEAYHVFGNQLARDLGIKTASISLRLTINELAANLEVSGTHVVGCYNYTGTPYANNKLLPEVVYVYGLREARDENYLKKVVIDGYKNTKLGEFIKDVITNFWKEQKDKKYELYLPKIAFFANTIDELEKELKPAVENALSDLIIPLDKILVNVGDPKLMTNDEIREFNNLDSPASEKQFILLINKGKEGWNCRSLFGVALFSKPKSKIFVLQATMSCLRKITDIQQTANVYLSEENIEILEQELQENFHLSINDITN